LSCFIFFNCFYNKYLCLSLWFQTIMYVRSITLRHKGIFRLRQIEAVSESYGFRAVCSTIKANANKLFILAVKLTLWPCVRGPADKVEIV